MNLTIDVRPFDFETLRKEKFVDDDNHLTYRAQDFLDDLWRRTGGVTNGLISNTNITESGTTVTVKSGSTFNIAGTFQLGGQDVTANATELNYNDGSIPGTSVASKTLVLGADRNTDYLQIDTTFNSAGALNITGTVNVDGNPGTTAGGFTKGILTGPNPIIEATEHALMITLMFG